MRQFSAPISQLPEQVRTAIDAILNFGSVRAVALVGSRANDLYRPDADDWDLEAYTSEAPHPDQQLRRDTWAPCPTSTDRGSPPWAA